jgi:hypothetical protein
MKELKNNFGRLPNLVLKIIRLEDLKTQQQQEESLSSSQPHEQILKEIMDWLLMDIEQEDDRRQHNTQQQQHVFQHSMKTNYDKLGSPTVMSSTRQWLEEFYEPYNKMLSRLLQDERWDYSNRQNTTNRPVVWPPHKNSSLMAGPYFQTVTKQHLMTTHPCHPH